LCGSPAAVALCSGAFHKKQLQGDSNTAQRPAAKQKRTKKQQSQQQRCAPAASWHPAGAALSAPSQAWRACQGCAACSSSSMMLFRKQRKAPHKSIQELLLLNGELLAECVVFAST
jgi:hypothetical protein